MTVTLDIVALMQGTILILIGLGVKALFNMKKDISLINGRLLQTETWQKQHDKQDDERHEETLTRMSIIEDRSGGTI